MSATAFLGICQETTHTIRKQFAKMMERIVFREKWQTVSKWKRTNAFV